MKAIEVRRVCLNILLGVAFLLTFAGTSGAKETLDELYKAAKTEGELVLQYMSSVEQVKPVADTFRKRFPDIKVSVVSIGSTSIITRIITEASAKRLTMDVATTASVYIKPLLDRDLFAKYDWTQIVGVDSSKIIFDGGCVYFGDSGKVWVYNTKVVSKAEVPRNWEDTLDPKWKGGKISVRAAPSGIISLFPLWKQDRQKATDYLKGLAKQEVLPEMRSSVVTNRVATGECPLGLATPTDVPNFQGKGAPIAVSPISPIAGYPSIAFIPKGGVKHPNAAKLLMAWMATKEGIEAFNGIDRGLYSPPGASPVANYLADHGIGFVRIQSLADIAEFSGGFSEAVVKILNFKPDTD